MADTKPLPQSASAEGETAALEAQVIAYGTVDSKTARKDNKKIDDTTSATAKGPDAGFKNYLVRIAPILYFNAG